MNLRNIISTKYHYRPDGIYFKDARWGMSILKPGFSQKVFYNGYTFTHQGNRLGIRSDRDISQADVVLLGDSFVYGHGVDFHQTLGFFLEEISGLKVANLGVQGDYLPFQYVRLKHLGLYLRPRVVLLFINGQQDAADFLIYRPTREYIKKIISVRPGEYVKGPEFSDYLRDSFPRPVTISDWLAWRLFSFRLVKGMVWAQVRMRASAV